MTVAIFPAVQSGVRMRNPPSSWGLLLQFPVKQDEMENDTGRTHTTRVVSHSAGSGGRGLGVSMGMTGEKW